MGSGGLGLHRLYVSMIYVLSDEAGEMHFPKDANLRELGVSSAQEASYRVMVLQDAVQLQEMALSLIHISEPTRPY